MSHRLHTGPLRDQRHGGCLIIDEALHLHKVIDQSPQDAAALAQAAIRIAAHAMRFAAELCAPPAVRTCRACGCTDSNCVQCVARTGKPCHWVERDLCSACEPDAPPVTITTPEEHTPCKRLSV